MMSLESPYSSNWLTPNVKVIFRPIITALYSATLFVQGSVSEYPLVIIYLCGDISTTPTPVVDLLVVPSKNNCHAFSLEIALTSADSLRMSSCNLEFFEIRCYARKLAIAYPFIDF